jgi:serine protease Do
MNDIIGRMRDCVVQIATPYGNGTGFYLKREGLIITNFHVIAGSTQAAVTGRKIKKTLLPVVCHDPLYDLAFIQPDAVYEEVEDIPLGESESVKEGNEVLAIGHPFGLKYASTRGIISKTKSNYNGIDYLQIDAPINPGNSGGPLVDENGKIIGVNTFIIKEGNSLGFALPVNYLQSCLEEFRKIEKRRSVRCTACSNLIIIDEMVKGYCPECGNKMEEEIYRGKPYIPSKTGEMMETVLDLLEYKKELCRMGIDLWQVERGSVKINISFVAATRFIVADAVIAQLPKKGLAPLYAFLLQKNYEMQRTVFSINNRDILLSLLIFESDFTLETAMPQFRELFTFADKYDDILVNQFDCVPTYVEEE